MSTDEFAGAGAPPVRAAGGAARGNFPEFGFEESIVYKTKEGERKQGKRRIFNFRVDCGEDNRPILLLDRMHSPATPRRAVYIHRFTGRDGKFGNLLVSTWKDDARGDPMNDALGKNNRDGVWHPTEPTWYWALSGIDLGTTTTKAGKTYTNTRVLVLVTDRQKDQFLGLEKMGKGLRGHLFNVSRDRHDVPDKKKNPPKTPAIGNKWDPQEPLTEEQMLNRFEKAAADYGLPVEKFLSPFDYPLIFKPKTREELEKIAADMKTSVVASADVKIAEGGEDIDF